MPFSRRKRQAPIGSETPYHPGTRIHGLSWMQDAGVPSCSGTRLGDLYTDRLPAAGQRHGINRATLEFNNA